MRQYVSSIFLLLKSSKQNLFKASHRASRTYTRSPPIYPSKLSKIEFPIGLVILGQASAYLYNEVRDKAVLMPGLGGSLLQSKDFVGQLSSSSGDLSSITAPPSLLSTKSTVEFATTWASHHDLFLAQADPSATPERRALSVLVNFLCSLKLQLYTGQSEQEGMKKPLNAFLGEVFLGVFEGEGGSTRVWCEQVSHHPPVTACALHNPVRGIKSEAYIAEKTSFSATQGLKVQQLGHATMTVSIPSTSESTVQTPDGQDGIHEVHLATLPTLELKNMLSGSPYPELSGKCYIVSSTGYLAEIGFEGQKGGMLASLTGRRGSIDTRNSLHATFYRIENMDVSKKVPLWEVEGRWTGDLKVTPHDASNSNGAGFTINISSLPTTPLTQTPLEQQDPYESRRAWQHVVKGIQNNDWNMVSKEKGKIEEAQRARRKSEEQSGVEWPRLFFHKAADESEDVKHLAKFVPSGMDLLKERKETAGVWQFVGFEEAMKIQEKGRLHEGMSPDGQVS